MAGGDDDHGGEHDTLPSWNIVVICTVGGVLLLEFITHQMNAAAKGKKHAMELLDGLYRELAILGVVAFVLWSINVSEYVTIEYNDKHLFEQIHMTLFLAALFHSFPIGMVVLYSRQTIRRWDLFEDDEMRRYKDLKQQYRRTAAQLGLRHSQLKRGVGVFKWACLWTSHPMLCRRLSELSEHVSYHALRSQFIKNNQLPKNFRFAAYLKKCEQEVVIGLAEIKHGVWVGLILFVGVELYVKGIMGKATSNADGRALFLLAAALVILAALAVHFKLRSIYSAMVDTYRPSAERKDDLAQHIGPDTSAQIIQQDMFWFGKPHLLLTALQTMQFVLAVMVSALIWFGAGESKGLVIVAEMLLAVGAFAIYIVVLPKFIPRFTQVTHIGGMVNRNILSETLLKQKNSFQRRALPPTLRQISAMARLKSNEAQEDGKFARARKLMSGQTFREVMKVMVGVHFFVIAYNTEQVQQNSGDGDAWVAEMVLAGIALLVEISTHFIVWRGMACFHLSPFVEVPARMVNTLNKPAAAIYPSSSNRRQLLANDSNGSPKASSGHDLEFGRSSGATSARKETHRVCSVWACFGWRGGDYIPAEGDGFCGCLKGVPSQSVVGAWRTLDLFLVLVVLGCSIATGLVDGVSRVVVHAIQGIVVLRLWPLWRCPFPAAFGVETIRNVDGGTVHLAPLDNSTLESVMQETLTLLRRQNPQERTFEAKALMGETSNDAMTDQDRAKHLHNPPTDKLTSSYNGTQGTIAEAKDEDNDSEHGTAGSTDGIANVGVAMALQQAFTAHPDLVQSHGPLSVPMLRAMLGLDPLKTSPHDNAKAFAIAARAVTLARSHSRTEEDVSRSSNPVVRRAIHRSRSSSVEVPPPPVLSSPSSSDLSDGDTYDGAGRSVLGNSQHEGGKRGRISSFLSGSRHSWKKTPQQSLHRQHSREKQQQQLSYQQQEQQLLYQQQVQVQMMQQQHHHHHHQQLQYQQYQLGRNVASTDLGSVTDYQERPPYVHDTDQDTLRMLRSEHRGEFMSSQSLPMGGLSDATRHTPFDPFTPATAGSVSSIRRGGSVRSSNSTLHSHSRHSRRGVHGSNTSDNTGGTVPPAVEDLERPVLPSVVRTTGPQYSAGNGESRGVGSSASSSAVGKSGPPPASRVPYTSGRSVPQSSSHNSAWKGTPARALKVAATSTHDHPLMPPDRERAAPLRSKGAIGTGEGGGGGAGGDIFVDSGSSDDSGEDVSVGGSISGSDYGGDTEDVVREVRTSDATASVSGTSTTAQNSTTPSSYLANNMAFQPKGDNAE